MGSQGYSETSMAEIDRSDTPELTRTNRPELEGTLGAGCGVGWGTPGRHVPTQQVHAVGKQQGVAPALPSACAGMTAGCIASSGCEIKTVSPGGHLTPCGEPQPLRFSHKQRLVSRRVRWGVPRH